MSVMSGLKEVLVQLRELEQMMINNFNITRHTRDALWINPVSGRRNKSLDTRTNLFQD